MEKLIGLKKVKTAVLISGNGSNLKQLIKFSNLKKSPINIEIVISSNPSAKGLEIAKKYKIKTKILSFHNKFEDENKIIKIFKDKKINLICLAGFMKILSKNFIKNLMVKY